MSQPVLSTIEGRPCPTTIGAACRSLPLPGVGDDDDDDDDDVDDDDNDDNRTYTCQTSSTSSVVTEQSCRDSS